MPILKPHAFEFFSHSAEQTLRVGVRLGNYMQKGDGSFRDSSLVSPLQYLLIQAICKTIAEKYLEQRNADISVYYSGNILKRILIFL